MNLRLNNLKTAIVYDRVVKFGGAERVLLTLHEMFPNAPLYTSLYDKERAKWARVFPKIYTSFLQNIPILKKHHELLGWLMPIAFESFDFKNYDLVISVTSEAAKGIVTSANTLHICYCLTPTRYLWSGYNFYLKNPPKVFRVFPFYKILSWPFLTYLKWWDKIAVNRPDKMIAISSEVKKRIKKYYHRDSEIIYPPVNLTKNKIKASGAKKYYFIHGRFEPYKRLDLVINTFKKTNLSLIVSGTGSEFEKYRNKKHKNIKFIYNPSDEQLLRLYKNAKAFLMPQEEDFGITSVEAQSLGIPVIAYKKGGALDTVINNKTGIFFDEQTESSLNKAIAKFDTISFNGGYLETNAKRFGKDKFERQLQRSLIRTYSSWRRGN